MTDRSQILQAVDSKGDGLRVVFLWNGDRFAHRIEHSSGNATVVLLESLESSDSRQWPLSPPLQQLSIEERPDDHQVALLVGMSGHSHWSASITASRNDRSLLFEMACRMNDPSASLLSSYRILESAQLVSEGDNQVRWPHVAFSTSSATMEVVRPARILEVRALDLSISGMTTVQWAYQLRWLVD